MYQDWTELHGSRGHYQVHEGSAESLRIIERNYKLKLNNVKYTTINEKLDTLLNRVTSKDQGLPSNNVSLNLKCQKLEMPNMTKRKSLDLCQSFITKTPPSLKCLGFPSFSSSAA